MSEQSARTIRAERSIVKEGAVRALNWGFVKLKGVIVDKGITEI